MELIIGIAIVCVIVFYFIYIFGAHKRTKKLLKKYSKIKNSSNLTGENFIQISFEYLGYSDCSLKYTNKENFNCYIPKYKLIVLNQEFCFKPSLSALGVAAHELGHCIQHKTNNVVYVLTNFFRTLSHLASFLLAPTVVLTLYFIFTSQHTAGLYSLVVCAILLMAGMLFKLLLIPCELNASEIGVKFLKKLKLISHGEERDINKILKAAGNTYVADFYRTLCFKGNKK